MKQKFVLFLLLLFWAGVNGQTLPNYGDGAHGNLTVNTTYYVDNVKDQVSSITAASPLTDQINLGGVGTGSFILGDYVLIIDMEPPQSCNARNYYIRKVQGVNANGIVVNTLSSSLGTAHTQVIKIYRYNNLTINNGGTVTCSPYTGQIGGVICFMVKGTLTVNSGGVIDASEKILPNSPGGAGGSAGTASGSGGGTSTIIQANGGDATLSSDPRVYGSPGFCFTTSGGKDCGNFGPSCGGNGGTGTAPRLGGAGGSGGGFGICNDDRSIYLLTAGSPGKSGKGGMGPGAGGNGGGGGNSNGVVSTVAAAGTAGSGPTGGAGGDGGTGGYGGGIIYIMASNVSTSVGAIWVKADGGPGNNGMDASGTGGNGGDGGRGQDKKCNPRNNPPGTWIDAGGRGATGIGGNGGVGGGGGGGGNAGTIWGTTAGSDPFAGGYSLTGGSGGTGGAGTAGGTNGNTPAHASHMVQYGDCGCTSGGSGGGGTTPTVSPTFQTQNKVFECECYIVYWAMSNYCNTSPSTSGTTATYSPSGTGTDREGNTMSNIVVTIDWSTGLATLDYDILGFNIDGNTGDEHRTYKCEASVAAVLGDFVGDYTASTTSSPYATSWPRSVAFGSSNGEWTYYEDDPLTRYLQEDDDVPNDYTPMVDCNFFETGSLSSLNGWNGKTGSQGTSKNYDHKSADPANVPEDDLTPVFLSVNDEPKNTKSSFTVTPNPADKELTLNFDKLQAGTYKIEITDMLGKTVYSNSLPISNTTNQYTIPSENLKVGTYIVHLRSKTTNLERQVIIQR